MGSLRGEFEAGCARGVLLYQWDGERAVFPPSARFSEWRESAGAGTVYAATVIRPRGGAPRSVVLVDLDEGFRMMSSCAGAAVGDRVTVWFDGEGVPRFRAS